MGAHPFNIVYNWSPQKYIELVENTSNSKLKEYEEKELEYITTKIPALKTSTIIDVGAGYGRILPHLAPLTQNIVAVDINHNMFGELKRRTMKYPNVTAIQGDASYLSKLLNRTKLTAPVILSLQNSLGTWEGDPKKIIAEMKKIAHERQGEVIISLHRQKALKTYGIEMFKSVEALVGKIDLRKTDFKKRIFRSKTGYLSKWWNDSEVKEIIKRLGGKKIKKIENPNFIIINVVY